MGVGGSGIEKGEPLGLRRLKEHMREYIDEVTEVTLDMPPSPPPLGTTTTTGTDTGTCAGDYLKKYRKATKYVTVLGLAKKEHEDRVRRLEEGKNYSKYVNM